MYGVERDMMDMFLKCILTSFGIYASLRLKDMFRTGNISGSPNEQRECGRGIPEENA